MLPRRVLWIIISLSIISLAIDLPKIPIKFTYGPLKVESQIGGYEINLFDGKFSRDLEIKKGLDISGGIRVTLRAEMETIEKDSRQEALDSVRNVLEKRVNLFGVAEPNVLTAKSGDEYRVVVELPGVYDTARALRLIGQTAKLDFKRYHPEATLSASVQKAPPTLNDLYLTTDISGKDLKKARLDFDSSTGAPQVAFEMTEEGGKKFKTVTEELSQKASPEERVLGIFLDDNPISLPEVKSVISDRGVITGNFSLEAARDLSLKLNAGALPVPIKVVAQENLGPTLGSESIKRSLFAGVVGLVIVSLFMIGLYGRLGLIADGALIVYGLLTLALYKLVPVVLTLPGIAGFLLSIGMAVDANILIFERMKEEVQDGRTVGAAMELGFGRAWNSIRDANIATLITCFILFNPLSWSFLNVSGLVRGFAFTLALGIFISLFTQIVVSRTLIRIFYR